jgi:hypothetical protein
LGAFFVFGNSFALECDVLMDQPRFADFTFMGTGWRSPVASTGTLCNLAEEATGTPPRPPPTLIENVDEQGITKGCKAKNPRAERDGQCDQPSHQDQPYCHARLQRFVPPTMIGLRLNCGIFGAEKTGCFPFENNGGFPPKHKGLLG